MSKTERQIDSASYIQTLRTFISELVENVARAEGYIATLEVQNAAKDRRIAELELQLQEKGGSENA